MVWVNFRIWRRRLKPQLRRTVTTRLKARPDTNHGSSEAGSVIGEQKSGIGSSVATPFNRTERDLNGAFRFESRAQANFVVACSGPDNHDETNRPQVN